LKISLGQELWEAIEKNYENESYSSAILDAMHILTETIRNKTGLEGDGSSLVGQAFGGENPKLQLNKLQTESQKNIQKGTQEIIRGLYTAIRNPRSHDKYNDTKEEADSVIYFISYILKIIDKSKVDFEESLFLKRVFEEYYVKTKEYSELLANEIPKRQRTDIAISIIIKRENGNIDNLRYFMKALFDKLDEKDIAQVFQVINEELKYTDSDKDIHTILHIIPASCWCKLDKIVKIRVENILLESVRMGKYVSLDKTCRFGHLGTWVEAEHIMNFEDVTNWTRTIIKKITDGNDEEKAYIEKHFFDKICNVNRDNIDYALKKYFINGLENNDIEVVGKLKLNIIFEENHPWWKVFEKELKNFPEIEYLELPF